MVLAKMVSVSPWLAIAQDAPVTDDGETTSLLGLMVHAGASEIRADGELLTLDDDDGDPRLDQHSLSTSQVAGTESSLHHEQLAYVQSLVKTLQESNSKIDDTAKAAVKAIDDALKNSLQLITTSHGQEETLLATLAGRVQTCDTNFTSAAAENTKTEQATLGGSYNCPAISSNSEYYGGGDYKQLRGLPESGGAEQCQTACGADPKCKSWTFIHDTHVTVSAHGMCYLKDDVPALRSPSAGVSAGKPCTGTLSLESAHASCRASLKKEMDDQKAKCDALTNFISGLVPPSSSVPSGDLTNYWSKLTTYHSANYPRWKSLKDACDAASDQEGKRKVDCASKQQKFEAAMCALQLSVLSSCSEYDSCYSIASQDFQSADSSAAVQEKQRQLEWTAIKKIQCYIKILLSEETPSMNDVTACKDLVPDTSALALTRHTLVAEQDCDWTSVQEVPCDGEFLKKFDGMVDLTNCQACPALPAHLQCIRDGTDCSESSAGGGGGGSGGGSGSGGASVTGEQIAYYGCPYSRGRTGMIWRDLLAPYKPATQYSRDGSAPIVLPVARRSEVNRWYSGQGDARPMPRLYYNNSAPLSVRTEATPSATRCKCSDGRFAAHICDGAIDGTSIMYEYNSCDLLCKAQSEGKYYEKEWSHGPCPKGKDIETKQECRDALASLGWRMGTNANESYNDRWTGWKTIGMPHRDYVGLKWIGWDNPFLGCARQYTDSRWNWKDPNKPTGHQADPKKPANLQWCMFENMGRTDPKCGMPEVTAPSNPPSYSKDLKKTGECQTCQFVPICKK